MSYSRTIKKILFLILIVKDTCAYLDAKQYAFVFKLVSASCRRRLGTEFAAENAPRDIFIASDSFKRDDIQDRRVLKLISSLEANNDDFLAPIWKAINYEAESISETDILAATIMANSILSQPSLQEAIICYVANQLETSLLPATQLRNIFSEVCEQRSDLSTIWALDIISSTLRDSSRPNMISVLLFSKGFHSLVVYRIANQLWYSGRDELARYFQSLASRMFGSDIHPACTIGHGCYVSSGTGIVIGETARVGNDVSISHGITLGGTGKESGDRHPKVGNGVSLRAGSTILGNIKIGDGAIINAGSVVTKPVAPFTRVGGVPAYFISNVTQPSHNAFREESETDMSEGNVTSSLNSKSTSLHSTADENCLPQKYIDYLADDGIDV